MTTFEQIKKLSDERKISLKDLANKLGFGENYFYNMKNAKSSPSSEVLLKVADYFHVSVDYLLGREGDYKFDDYPFKVSVTQKKDGSFNINCQPVKYTPGTLLQTIRDVKSDLEKSYNQIPDFNTEDSVWTVNHVEEQFIEELVKNNVWVVRLKQNDTPEYSALQRRARNLSRADQRRLLKIMDLTFKDLDNGELEEDDSEDF